MNKLYVFIFLPMYMGHLGKMDSFQVFEKWKNQFPPVKNLGEGQLPEVGNKGSALLKNVILETCPLDLFSSNRALGGENAVKHIALEPQRLIFLAAIKM